MADNECRGHLYQHLLSSSSEPPGPLPPAAPLFVAQEEIGKRGHKYYHRVRVGDYEVEWGTETLGELLALIGRSDEEPAIREALARIAPSTIPIPAEHQAAAKAFVDGDKPDAGKRLNKKESIEYLKKIYAAQAPLCHCGAPATHATREKGREEVRDGFVYTHPGNLYQPYCAEHAPLGAFGIIPEAKDSPDAPVVAKPANPFERGWR